ncbi:MAG TPA: NAD(P)/FAD-dependent oxidoreductase [Candidatus Sulfotelmatobacter sp.]|nr:NAD(P)/FAD-dependent oxidoreductase [Candidatus Sulfotelmatobacter sp.]
MTRDPVVIVIGGGVAGLAAASELGHTGVAVCLVEARERIGGRVFTQRIPGCDVPIELGAEFIHGRPREILVPLERAGIQLTEVSGDSWCVSDGRLSRCDFWSQVEEVLEKMDDSRPDESFVAFLDRCFGNPKNEAESNVREHVLGYVSGFNAADPALVGVHWLVQQTRAEERIGGDHSYRARNGYADLLDVFQKQMEAGGVTLRTQAAVEKVKWRQGNAEVSFHERTGSSSLEAPRVLITLPLAILKASRGEACAVEFTPSLPQRKLEALDKMEMGKVIRIVLRFRERFWGKVQPRGSGGSNLAEMSFLFSEDEYVPTWWTTMPRVSPVITGWAPFRSAERLSGKSREFVIEQALKSLSTALKMSPKELDRLLEGAYFHDWQSDPFSRGAYSYGKVGAVEAEKVIAEPVDDTLFFAGEATDTSGNNGTVHGAIASGKRAAKQILQGLEFVRSRATIAV